MHEDVPAADASVLQQECWRQSEKRMAQEGILDSINMARQSLEQNEECRWRVRLTLMPRILDWELFVSLETQQKPARPAFLIWPLGCTTCFRPAFAAETTNSADDAETNTDQISFSLQVFLLQPSVNSSPLVRHRLEDVLTSSQKTCRVFSRGREWFCIRVAGRNCEIMYSLIAAVCCAVLLFVFLSGCFVFGNGGRRNHPAEDR